MRKLIAIVILFASALGAQYFPPPGTGGGGGASGTVTQVNTSSPLGGGPITDNGTITCATCAKAGASLTLHQLLFGAGSQDLAVGDLTGDVTTGGGTATTIGAGKVTNGMLAGSIAASKLVGTDIATVGTIAAGTWQGTVVGAGYGGTNNAFTSFSGPATSIKTYNLPNVSTTILTTNSVVTVPQGGSGLSTITSNALVKGAGTGAMVVTGCTVDSSDNLNCPGGVTTGAASGTSGFWTPSGSTSGSATVGVANAAGTPNRINLPTATSANPGLLESDGSNPQQTSWRTSTGTGSVVRAASPTLTGTMTVADLTVSGTCTGCSGGGGGGALITRGAFGSVPGCSTTQFLYLTTDGPYEAHCDGSSSLQWFIPEFGSLTPAANVTFGGWINQSTATRTTVGGSVRLEGTTASATLNAQYIAIPSTPYTIITCLADLKAGQGGNRLSGLFLSNGTTAASSDSITWGGQDENTGTGPYQWNDFLGSFNAALGNGVSTGGTSAPVCLAISDNATTRKFFIGHDTSSLWLAFSQASNSYITPTHYGIFVSANTSGVIPVVVFYSLTPLASAI